MVTFTCNYCGESIKKNQVDKHLSGRCHGCSLCCIDCLRDFDGMSYRHHTECVTEAERYSGGNFKPKVSTVNSRIKRQEWIDLVKRVAQRKGEKRSEGAQALLTYVASLTSVPDKKIKFSNQVANGCKRFLHFVDETWAILDKEKEILVANRKAATEKALKESGGNKNGTDKPEKEEEKEITEESPKKKKKKSETPSECDDVKVLATITTSKPMKELTRKEMKKLQKQEKFKAEVAAIESNEELVDAPKKKSKKSKENGEVEEEDDGTKKDKKKKAKKSKDNGEVEEQDDGAKDKKKKGKKSKENGVVEEEDNGAKDKKKKKKKGMENGNHIEEETENGETEVAVEVESKKKAKKRKRAEEVTEAAEVGKKSRLNDTLEVAEDSQPGKFPWRDVILQVLESSKGGSLTLKKLRRKVMSEYQAHGADPADKGASVEKLETKLMKALKKTPNVIVKHETVELVR